MINSYKKAFLALIVLQTLYFSPMILQGAVIFPHNNGFEVTGLVVDDNTGITNRKFSDQSSVFIPEVNQHLHGHQQAWLSTWNPHVQLGRPTFQLAGLGKAYLPTHLLSMITGNPFILYSCLTVLTIYLTGLFCFLFLKALELHPLACFSIAAGFSLGTFLAYWLTFIMFLSVICWTLALLWLITEFIKHKSFTIAVGITFASYSLLMTAYPQSLIMHAYLITGFTLMRLWQAHYNLKAKFYTALALAGAALFGTITALPAYLDLITTAQRSARLNVSDEFFLAVLPPRQNINELALFLSQLFDAFWFGNPIKPEYPFVFNGLSLTPFYFILLLLSLADGQWRQLWPWQLFIAACLLATIWPPAYLFMVHYLGFHLSRALPLGGAIIPGFILAGYVLDHILRKGLKQFFFLIALLVTPLLLVSIVGFSQRPKLQLDFVILCFLLTLGTGWFVVTKKPILLILLTIASVWAYGFTIVLIQPLTEIQTFSPLVDGIKSETEDGSRYALIGQDLGGILPPNQESLLQINSIHSYDSLSSTHYQGLVQQLSETGVATYGRYFSNIASEAKLDQPAFSYTGINLLLSRHSLNNSQFRETNEINGIKLYKPLTPPILAAQLTNFSDNGGEQVILTGSLHEQSRLQINKSITRDDFMRFKVTSADKETLLFVSQQAHPYWQATSQGRPLPTITINNFYLGAVIPPQTTEVELEFRPFVIWSWIPQVIYSALGFGLLIGWLNGSHEVKVKQLAPNQIVCYIPLLHDLISK